MEDKFYKHLKKYYQSPQWIKNLIGLIYKGAPHIVRYGKKYCEFENILSTSRVWSKDEIANYQWRRIEEIIHHSYGNIPYYKNLFDSYGLHPKKIQNYHDFKKIPFLTKDIIRKNLDDLIAKNIAKRKLLYISTGGTTGPPLGLYYQKGVSRSKEAAFINFLFKQIGYYNGDKIAVLRGTVIKDAEKKNFCTYDPIKNRLMMSPFHMTKKNLPVYVRELRKFKPKFLHVYPSALAILADFIKENDKNETINIEAVISSSETLYDWQKKLFKEVFRCKIFSIYGLVELCALAAYCEKSEIYHFLPEYSFVELIEKSSTTAEIVGTTFDNYAMPLIRYRTMDYAEINGDCSCGRKYLAAKKILGRKQEFFVDKTNSLITFIYADVPLWEIKNKISAYQYVQSKPGTVKLYIEEIRELNELEIKALNEKLKLTYPGFDFKIKKINHIPRTENGKFRYLIQNLSIDFKFSNKMASN